MVEYSTKYDVRPHVIYSLLTGNHTFRVPNFQRDYVWGTKEKDTAKDRQVNAFFDDIYEFKNNNETENAPIAQSLFSFPFVAIIIRARLATFNLEQEEAAFDLGASPGQVFTNVFLPHIRPALIVSGLIAFTLSLDDFVITFFTSGPDTITVPIKIYSMVRFSVTPEVNAASTILLLITLCAAGIALWVHRAKISRIGKL